MDSALIEFKNLTFIEWRFLFTTVPFQPLTDQRWRTYPYVPTETLVVVICKLVYNHSLRQFGHYLKDKNIDFSSLEDQLKVERAFPALWMKGHLKIRIQLRIHNRGIVNMDTVTHT